MEEDPELLELETPPERGVSGVLVARDPQGLFVTKAPRSLRVRPGDRLLGARIFFEGASPEAVARVLEGVGGCRVSLWVRRRPSHPGSSTHGTPPTGTHGGPAGSPRDGDGTHGKPLLKPPVAPGALELALPKLAQLAQSRSDTGGVPSTQAQHPRVPPTRLTVKEAAAATKSPIEEPAGSLLPTVEVSLPKLGGRVPQVELVVPESQPKLGDGFRVPSVALELGAPRVESVATAGQPKAGEKVASRRSESPPVPPALPVSMPSIPIAVPRVDVGLDVAPLGVPAAPSAKGKVLARLGGALAKLRAGTDAPPPAPLGPLELALGPLGGGSGATIKLKVPKLVLDPPFGTTGEGAGGARGGVTGATGGGGRGIKPLLGGSGAKLGELGSTATPSLPQLRVPRVGIALPRVGGGPGGVKLPQFGGSSPEIWGGGGGGGMGTPPKLLRRGGSAETLQKGLDGSGSSGKVKVRVKVKGGGGDEEGEGGSPLSRFSLPAVGFSVPPHPQTPPQSPALAGGWKGLEMGGGAQKVPEGHGGVKGPKLGSGGWGGWGGRGVPDPQTPPINGIRCLRWVPKVGFASPTPEPPRTPKFQLPQLELRPQACGNW